MITLLYLLAGVLFIIGLRGLGSPRTARRGNQIAAAGMLLATVVTVYWVYDHSPNDAGLNALWWVIIVGLAIGGGIGALLALRVQMTAMPELVAAFNGFGGGASALVAFAAIVATDTVVATDAAYATETEVTVALSIAIGVVTFSGSFVAYGKLQGIITGRPVALPGGPFFNLILVILMTTASVWAIVANEPLGYGVLAGIALVLGVTGVIPIGGADMPVVISLLNSLSGVAASMAGFVIGNQGLIIAGALVGAAGFILTVQMSEAMNRSLANVLFAGFGTEGAAPIDAGDKPVNSATPEDVAISLNYLNFLANPIANSEAIVSALVFSNCPFLSCVIAQKTGVILLFKSSSNVKVFTCLTSPTYPKSTSLIGLFSEIILFPSAPEKPTELQLLTCNLATIFLLIFPA